MAGGFMAGFGSAFSESYNAGVKADRQQKDDEFKLRFSDYVTRRDKLEEQNKVNEKNVKTARRIAQMTGQPADAWGTAYDMLSGGATFDDVYKLYQNNQATISRKDQSATQGDTGQQAQPEGDLTANAANSVNAQMSASGMRTPPDGGVFKGAANAVGGIAQQEGQTPAIPTDNNPMHQGQRPSPIDERISRVTGANQQEIDKVMAANAATPPSPVPSDDNYEVKWSPKTTGLATKPDWKAISGPGEAAYALNWARKYGSKDELALAESLYTDFTKLGAEQMKQKGIAEGTYREPTRGRMYDGDGKANGEMVHRVPDRNGGYVWKDASGRQVDEGSFLPFDKGMEEELADIAKNTGKQTQEYNDNIASFKDLARTGDDLVSLASAYPQAMGMSGDVLQRFDSVRRTVTNIASILSPEVDPKTGLINVDSGAFKKLGDAERQVMESMKGPLDQAEKLALAATLMDIKSTKLAYLMASQSGAGTGRAISNVDFQNFKQAAIGGGNPEAVKLATADLIHQQYLKLKDQENAINSAGSAVGNFEGRYNTKSPDRPAMSVDDILANDPKTRAMIENFSGAAKNNSLTQTKQSTKIDPNDPPPEGITPEEWATATQEEKALWRK